MVYQVINTILEDLLDTLRKLLSNVKEEQKLIRHFDLEKINHLIEDRLLILTNYEENYQKLVSYTSSLYGSTLANFDPIEVLDILNEIVPVEEINLHYAFQQMKILIAEIHNQNSITFIFLEQHPLDSLSHSPNPRLVPEVKHQLKKKSQALQVLEEDSVE